MENTTNHKFKNYLADFKEFASSNSETGNYEAPYAAIIPAKNDKIWYYIKAAMLQGPRWGHKFKEQEWDNQHRGIRDGDPGSKPIEDAKHSQITEGTNVFYTSLQDYKGFIKEGKSVGLIYHFTGLSQLL